MFRFDVTKLPFADGSFDAIICLHVLEHVEDDLSAMREFRRVLTPEGLAVLQVPIGGDTTIEDPVTDPRERLKRYGQEDHVRLYGRDFEKRLVNAGFRVTRVDPADELSETDRVRLGLHLGEPPLYVCEAAVLR
jgi:SAM-dependent methyltransferase